MNANQSAVVQLALANTSLTGGSTGQSLTPVSCHPSRRLIDVVYGQCAQEVSPGHNQVNEPKRQSDSAVQRPPSDQRKTAQRQTATRDGALPKPHRTRAGANPAAKFCEPFSHSNLLSDGDNAALVESSLDVDYGRAALDASRVRVDVAKISEAGVTVAADVLSQFNLNADARPTMLIMPGALLMTNHPQKQEILRAIEELQYRQDELKVDFSRAILALVSKLQLL